MARAMKQLALPCKGRGGWRPGAGRKRNPKSGVWHVTRPKLSGREPLHITLRIRKDVPNLRNDKHFYAIQAAFRAACDRFGMRLIEFSVQSNHIHLIVEAKNKDALSKGMQGLLIRIARGVNRVSKRRGSVFSDRYHQRVLRSPKEVRNAVNYVRKNFNKHVKEGRPSVDPYSSMCGAALWVGEARVAAFPTTWLMTHSGVRWLS